jgi:hypothetical protein
MSRLSRQCGILNISQPHRPPRPATGICWLSLSFELEGTLKMKSERSSETPAYLYHPRRGHIPEYSNVHWLRHVLNMPSCLTAPIRGGDPPVAHMCCSSHGREHLEQRLAASASRGRFLCPPPVWRCFANGLKTSQLPRHSSATHPRRLQCADASCRGDQTFCREVFWQGDACRHKEGVISS